MSDALKRPAPAEGPADHPGRQKKKGGGRGGQAPDIEVNPADYVRVVPYTRTATEDERHGPVLLSKADKAAQLQLGDDRLSVTGTKGYRSVRATHGAHEGTWYCEVTVAQLGPTGHVRLGWTTRKADINAPVGFDAHGVAYRDLEGTKVHRAMREPYGAPFGEGDVVGMLLHMPPGGKPHEAGGGDVVRYKGALYLTQEDEGEPQPLAGSLIGFSLNGQWQGAAAADVLEGTYYPTASLYTLPSQAEGARVAFNFGPDFKHAPPSVEGLPAARPLAELGARQAAAAPGVPAAGGPAAPQEPGAATAALHAVAALS